MLSPDAELERIASEVLAPLVELDGGQLYIVQVRDKELLVHLTGRFAGCAGNELATQNVLEPALQAAVPGARLSVSTGPLIPSGARLVQVKSVED